MATETGHEPNRVYTSQDGALHLNGAPLWNAAEEDVRAAGLFVVSFVYGEALSIDQVFFVAHRAYKVKAITVRPLVAGTDAGAVTAEIRKAASGTAINAGTILHTGTADLKGTINTNQALTLTATAADLLLAAGDALGIDVTGVQTAARGLVSVALQPNA